jgi:hypothetical protein
MAISGEQLAPIALPVSSLRKHLLCTSERLSGKNWVLSAYRLATRTSNLVKAKELRRCDPDVFDLYGALDGVLDG